MWRLRQWNFGFLAKIQESYQIHILIMACLKTLLMIVVAMEMIVVLWRVLMHLNNARYEVGCSCF